MEEKVLAILQGTSIVICSFAVLILVAALLSRIFVKENRKSRSFWSRYAGIYNRFMKKDQSAYLEICRLIRPVIKDKTVLELATGTGLMAKQLVHDAKSIEATDYSEEMIREAKKGNYSKKLHFSVQDMFSLPYADESFEIILVSNALHVVPNPEKALSEIRRVLKNEGVLIAPTFVHANLGIRAKAKAAVMKIFGFPLHHAWTAQEYETFLSVNGWKVQKGITLKASFPLFYAECVKAKDAYTSHDERPG